jgi:hypothetical protein
MIKVWSMATADANISAHTFAISVGGEPVRFMKPILDPQRLPESASCNPE